MTDKSLTEDNFYKGNLSVEAYCYKILHLRIIYCTVQLYFNNSSTTLNIIIKMLLLYYSIKRGAENNVMPTNLTAQEEYVYLFCFKSL